EATPDLHFGGRDWSPSLCFVRAGLRRRTPTTEDFRRGELPPGSIKMIRSSTLRLFMRIFVEILLIFVMWFHPFFYVTKVDPSFMNHLQMTLCCWSLWLCWGSPKAVRPVSSFMLYVLISEAAILRLPL
ncbi:hypothetical protein B296_00039104, partial [Ensete ventricosum]